MDIFRDAMLDERRALRDELVQLKNCQVRYFALSLAATGALVGWGASTQSPQTTPSPVFLTPLLVLLPCWCIFFDKATTITRIVGYYRHLESWIVSDESESKRYRGWEQALREFRDFQKTKSKTNRFKMYFDDLGKGLRELILPTTAHRYWVINWHTFFCLSAVSWVFGANVWVPGRTVLSRPDNWAWLFFTIIILTALHMASLVGSLIRGHHSYDENEKIWEEVFSNRNV